jgi:hypothetical protein
MWLNIFFQNLFFSFVWRAWQFGSCLALKCVLRYKQLFTLSLYVLHEAASSVETFVLFKVQIILSLSLNWPVCMSAEATSHSLNYHPGHVAPPAPRSLVIGSNLHRSADRHNLPPTLGPSVGHHSLRAFCYPLTTQLHPKPNRDLYFGQICPPPFVHFFKFYFPPYWGRGGGHTSTALYFYGAS